VITAVAFWGGIHVIVPEGIDVQLEGFSFMGGRNLKVRDVPVVPGSPRIRVRGYAVMGGIDIRSRSSRSGRQIAQAVAEGVLGRDAVPPSLADVAGPGEIVVSSLSEQLVVRSGEFRFGDHREVALKGLTTPQQAASLVWAD
jgi:hypothetical protein